MDGWVPRLPRVGGGGTLLDMKRSTEIKAEERARAIWKILCEGGVADEGGEEVVLRLIAGHLDGSRKFIELIIDSPVSANFRLKPVGTEGPLRLGYWGHNPERAALAEEISGRIADL